MFGRRTVGVVAKATTTAKPIGVGLTVPKREPYSSANPAIHFKGVTPYTPPVKALTHYTAPFSVIALQPPFTFPLERSFSRSDQRSKQQQQEQEERTTSSTRKIGMATTAIVATAAAAMLTYNNIEDDPVVVKWQDFFKERTKQIEKQAKSGTGKAVVDAATLAMSAVAFSPFAVVLKNMLTQKQLAANPSEAGYRLIFDKLCKLGLAKGMFCGISSYTKQQAFSSAAGGVGIGLGDKLTEQQGDLNLFARGLTVAMVATSAETAATAYHECRGLEARKTTLGLIRPAESFKEFAARAMGVLPKIYQRNMFTWIGPVLVEIYAKEKGYSPAQVAQLSLAAGLVAGVASLPYDQAITTRYGILQAQRQPVIDLNRLFSMDNLRNLGGRYSGAAARILTMMGFTAATNAALMLNRTDEGQQR